LCEHLLEIFDFILAYYFTEKIDQKSIQSINFPYFFFFPVRHFEWPSFGYQKFGSLVVVNFWVLIIFLVGFLDPHFVTVWMLYVTGYELFENDFLH